MKCLNCHCHDLERIGEGRFHCRKCGRQIQYFKQSGRLALVERHEELLVVPSAPAPASGQPLVRKFVCQNCHREDLVQLAGNRYVCPGCNRQSQYFVRSRRIVLVDVHEELTEAQIISVNANDHSSDRSPTLRPKVTIKELSNPAVNTCPGCRSSQVCKKCSGSGRSVESGRIGECYSCAGSGRCSECASHVDAMQSVIEHVKAGDLAMAEVKLHQTIRKTQDEEQSHRTGAGLGGAVIGGIVGTVLLPGFGTMIGAMAGRALGDEGGREGARNRVAWQQADLLFLLAAIYQRRGMNLEARQALVSALTNFPEHKPSMLALKGQ